MQTLEKKRKQLRPTTLAIKWPFGKTLLLSIIFIIMGLLIGETIFRSDRIQKVFTAPTWGTTHRQLELQLFRLEEFAEMNGNVDCIFIGNSMVMRGFDPFEFQQTLKDQTGENLICFNFGIDALTGVNAGILTKILIENYHPKFLIFGTDARDYVVPLDHKDTTVLSTMPWLQYHAGKFSFAGLLTEYVYIYRYRFILQKFLNFEYGSTLRANTKQLRNNSLGFDGDSSESDITRNIPQPNTENGHVNYYFQLLSDYKIISENWQGLEDIVQQSRNGVEVVVVAMPVPETYLYFFGNGANDYNDFISRVDELTDNYDVTFLQMPSFDDIHPQGWVDYSHLNTKGARVFSRWLGEQFSEKILFEKFKDIYQ